MESNKNYFLIEKAQWKQICDSKSDADVVKPIQRFFQIHFSRIPLESSARRAFKRSFFGSKLPHPVRENLALRAHAHSPDNLLLRQLDSADRLSATHKTMVSLEIIFRALIKIPESRDRL